MFEGAPMSADGLISVDGSHSSLLRVEAAFFHRHFGFSSM
jgi:hypothetical protein